AGNRRAWHLRQKTARRPARSRHWRDPHARRGTGKSARPLMTRPILLATRSAGKLNEMHQIFEDLGVEVTDLRALDIAEAPEEHSLEEFPTFEENALAKARYFFTRSGGIATIGDDSGLTIDALGGAPGVLTKRWSGRTDISGAELDRVNNEKLVRE